MLSHPTGKCTGMRTGTKVSIILCEFSSESSDICMTKFTKPFDAHMVITHQFRYPKNYLLIKYCNDNYNLGKVGRSPDHGVASTDLHKVLLPSVNVKTMQMTISLELPEFF